MKKLLAFLIFLLFLLLAWFSWSWYKNTVLCCDETPKEEVVAKPVKYGPLVFNCGSFEPITNELWPETKSKILSEQTEEKKLLITGPYFDGEEESAGLTRAENIKELFINDIDEDRFELAARKAGDCESSKANLLHESKIKWVTRNENVVEHHDKTIIYFKYDNTKEIDTENVVKYLEELIAYIKNNNATVNVIGHTDADGTQEYNVELGLKRANRVKDYLIKKGVAEDKIQVDSKGKSEPLSDNTSPEGKQKNRRVEIITN